MSQQLCMLCFAPTAEKEKRSLIDIVCVCVHPKKRKEGGIIEET